MSNTSSPSNTSNISTMQTTVVRPAVRANLSLQEKWSRQLATVPGRLKFSRTATIAAALLFAALAYFSYTDLRNAIQTIGHDTVPSIIAAEKVRATLADANANAVNFFLANETDDGPSWIAYRREMDDVQDNLIIAAQNITFGEEERQPIREMMTQLAVYERLIGQARAHRQNDFHPDLEAAEQVMRDKILNAAFALDKANFDHLSATYAAHRSSFGGKVAPAIAGGVLLFALLFSTQLFLAQRTRRTLNPGLVVATAALIVCALYAVSIFPKVENSLVTAKEDAFDSMHALWRARATAFDANADESFYLLDHGKDDQQAVWTKRFNEKTALLSAGDPDKAWRYAQRGTRFNGYLGDELANITFPGEKDAAMQAMKAWVAYMDIDQQIRRLDASGQYKEALALDIGTQPGDSNWAFAQFDDALMKTLEINQQAFDNEIAHAFNLLSHFVYALIAAVVIIIAAIVIGIKPRLDEYRFQ
jgi:hypothetical protein